MTPPNPNVGGRGPGGSPDRRKADRFGTQFPVKVEFYQKDLMMVPPKLGGDAVNESTGKFIWMEGELTSLNLHGASVSIPGLTREKYFRIARKQSNVYVNLHLRLPPENKRTRLFGCVRWSDFHQTAVDRTNLGIEFQELLDEDRARLEAFVAGLHRVDGREAS